MWDPEDSTDFFREMFESMMNAQSYARNSRFGFSFSAGSRPFFSSASKADATRSRPKFKPKPKPKGRSSKGSYCKSCGCYHADEEDDEYEDYSGSDEESASSFPFVHSPLRH